MSEQYNMFKKNPKTTFINAHMGWYGNNLSKLDQQLIDLPNVYVEFGAREQGIKDALQSSTNIFTINY